MLSWSLPAAIEARPFRAHDLLWIADRRALHAAGPLPSWVDAASMLQAPVVVRRERLADLALIPVGLRGRLRCERLAAYLDAGAVLRKASPEMLSREAAWRRMPALAQLPAAIALQRIAPMLDQSGLCWGPTGSIGYALASGLPVLRPDSDLDLLVRADAPLGADQERLLQAVLEGQGCRIDMQIDTGAGGFAFAEWIRGDGRVLLKTGSGPFLTGDPWNRSGWLDAAPKARA